MNDLEHAQVFIQQGRWIFAKTMPDIPHWYVRLRDCDPVEFAWMVAFVRRAGYLGSWRGRQPLRYWELDGWRYWSMGAPVAETTIVNRGRVDEPANRIAPVG